MSDAKSEDRSSTTTVLLLFIFLLLLAVLLVFFYRRLNRATDGAYALSKLGAWLGGRAERVISGLRALEGRMGLGRGGREGELGDEEAGEGGGEKEEEEEEEEEEDREKDVEACAPRLRVKSDSEDSEDDYSSMEGCDLRDRAKLAEEEEEEKEKEREGEKGGLLVDLGHFAGSASWAADESLVQGKDDMTAL